MRNFNYEALQHYYLENSCEFSNPFPTEWSGLFQIELFKEFLVGTNIHFLCKQLGIDQNIKTTSSTTKYPVAVRVPAGLCGVATVEVTLPSGTPGTPGSGVSLEFYVIPESNLLTCPYHHANQLGLSATHEIFNGGPAYLVNLGECSVAFV